MQASPSNREAVQTATQAAATWVREKAHDFKTPTAAPISPAQHADWQREISGLFSAESLEIYGNRGEVLPLPAGRVKDAITRRLPEPMLRFWLSNCRQGSLLFSRLRPQGGRALR